MNFTINTLTKTLLAALLFLALISPALQAQYTLTDDDVIVENGFIKKCITDTSHWGTTSIIIPISFHNTLITGIDTGAFESKNITEVGLPVSLKYLGIESFSFNNIKTLEIPENVKIIEGGVFYANPLETIVIPPSVNIIKSLAFELRTTLGGLSFEEGSNIRGISRYAFDGTFVPVKLPSNNNYGFKGYFDEDGTRYDVGQEIDFNAFNPSFVHSLFADIPTRILTSDDINLVNDEILRSQRYLTYSNIIIPSEINKIQISHIIDSAFYLVCLSKVIIEDGITKIGRRAFAVNFIRKLELPNTISVIQDSCFFYNSIDTIIIPASVTRLEHSAFNENWSKAVFLPNGLEYLGESCFAFNRFSDVKLPSSLSYIGPYAFKKNRDSLDITINLPNPVIKEGFEFSHWENAKGDTVAIIDDHTTAYTAMFTETQKFTVSGTVAIDEPQGLLFELSGDFERIYHANDDGTFNFPLNAGRTITVKPLRTGYTFTPDSISITNIQSDLSGFNFTAIQNNYSIRFKSGENGTITGDTLQTVGFKQLSSEVTAVGKNGYIFKYWIASNRELLTTDNPITLKLTKDIELEAVFDIAVGTEEKAEVSIKCFPNPAKSSLNIEAPGLISKVELYNTLGQKVYQKDKINAKHLNINVSDFTKGIYIVNISGTEFSQVIKVMVK